MNSLKRLAQTCLSIALSSLPLLAQTPAFTDLVDFNGANGASPKYSSLIQATDGYLYGTTSAGGDRTGGTVFRMTTSGKLTVLHSFCALSNCVDGKGPSSGVIQASDGQFYGTTQNGGSHGGGTVFRVSATGQFTTLYSFCALSGCADGMSPSAALVQGIDGSLYGTTYAGGNSTNSGTIFSITTSGIFKTLYSFCSEADCADGAAPYGGLVEQSKGSFYGTTHNGGSSDAGVLFSYSSWAKLHVRHTFCSKANCSDGSHPKGNMLLSGSGTFYGTTEFGGSSGQGTVFTLGPGGFFSKFYDFSVSDGGPTADLVAANDGNLYGTTWSAGSSGNAGLIFSLDYAAHFVERYRFCELSDCTAKDPMSGVLQDTDGNFYGMANLGGANGDGLIFRLSEGLPAYVKPQPTAGIVGSTVNILGNNLAGTSSVLFGGVSATFTVVSGSLITATVPAGASSGAIQVTTPHGELVSYPDFEVTF